MLLLVRAAINRGFGNGTAESVQGGWRARAIHAAEDQRPRCGGLQPAACSSYPQYQFQFALTSIFFTFDCASWVFGRVTVRTPFLNSALAFSVSTPEGSGVER